MSDLQNSKSNSLGVRSKVNKALSVFSVVLTEDAGHAWRWISIRAMAIDSAFLISWATVPADLKAALPSWLVPMMAVFVLVVGMIGRVIKQGDKDAGV